MTDQPPRLPGVRYRKVKRTALEPVTYNGETKMVRREWTEEVPRLPLDLDRLYVRAAVCVAVLLTAVAVVWSTMAIGRQLGHLVPEHPRIGYLGAAAFELPWVTCLAIAWVLRTQPDRARPVNVAGWIGLGIVVAAIVLDGYRVGAVEVGVLGAFVSVIAKGLWWVIIGLFHVQLDEDRAGWLNAKRQDLNVARVMLGEQQRMSGMEAYLAAFGVDSSAPVRPAIGPAAPAPVAELPSAPSVPAGPPAPPAPVVPSAPAPSAPSAPAAPPAPPVPAVPSAPAPVVPSAPSGQASAPAPAVPSAPDPVVPSAPSGQASAPAPAVPSAPDPVPSVPDDEEPESGEQAPAVPIGTLTIASVVRALLARDPGLRDVDRRPELVRLAAEQLPEQHKADPAKFAQTVKRNLRPKDTKPRRKAAG